MDTIDIINFARKPVSEVWFLRVTTVSKNNIPITKTAYRRIGTPKEKLIDDLILMIRGRLNTFMRGRDPDQFEPIPLEDAGFKFYLLSERGRSDLKDWDEEAVARGVDMLKGPFEWWMDGAYDKGKQNPECTISCIITNAVDSYAFEIIPNWLPTEDQPPKSFAIPPSQQGNTVTLFVKCVPVKVK